MRRLVTGIMILAVIGAHGCVHLRLQGAIVAGAGDWTMEGGGPARTNVSSGKIRPPLSPVWKYDAGAGFGHTAAIAGGNIMLAATFQGEVHAVDITSGKRLGAYDFGMAIMGSPLLEKQYLYVALTRSLQNIVCYDVEQGRSVWKATVDDIESSPLYLCGRLIVVTLRGAVLCLNTLDGSTLWKYELPQKAGLRNIRCSPSGSDSLIVVGTDRGEVIALSIDGSLRWSTTLGGGIVTAPSISSDRVFVASTNGNLTALDLHSGTRVWQFKTGSKFYASAAADSGRVIACSADGAVYSLSATTGSVDWEFHMQGIVDAAPVIAGDFVFVGGLDKTIQAIDLATGEPVWNAHLEGRMKTTPLVSAGFLLVLCDDRNIQAFRSTTAP